MSEPSSRSLEQARNLITQLNRGEPCDPNDDDIIPTALALDTARAEERRLWLHVVERAVADERERCAAFLEHHGENLLADFIRKSEERTIDE